MSMPENPRLFDTALWMPEDGKNGKEGCEISGTDITLLDLIAITMLHGLASSPDAILTASEVVKVYPLANLALKEREEIMKGESS